MVCEITPSSPFQGYVRDLQQTEKKKLHDVHRKGDLYFNTGDLLSVDEEGFFYFQDRVGDTFRLVRFLVFDHLFKTQGDVNTRVPLSSELF